MPKWLAKTALAVLPAVLAFWGVQYEGALRVWFMGRPAAGAFIMLLIGTCLLNPKLRNQLLIALCYGVAFLAVRDMYVARDWRLPFPIDPDEGEALIRAALTIIALLSAVAAVAETVTPGTVWSRRLYFGAAALFCFGLGVRSYGRHGSWQGIVLCATGFTAVIGSLFADRIVSADSAGSTRSAISDEAEQRLRDDEHVRALRDKEWQDPSSSQSAEIMSEPS